MIAELAYWLMGWAKYLGVIVINFFIDCINAAIVTLAAFVATVANLFPSGSPLPTLPAVPTDSSWGIVINALNWLFPIQFFISCITFITASILAYVVIAPLARWLKLLR